MNLINRKQLKEKLNLSTPTIIKLEREGVIPRIQLGGKIFYNLDELDANFSFIGETQSPKLMQHLKNI
jgi:DNA-binding XRE family transcriptional regulator